MRSQGWATLATLITAVAALGTVLELRWQRRADHQPELVVSPDAPLQIARRMRGGSFHHWAIKNRGPVPDAGEFEGTGLPGDFTLELRNVGVGAAKSITYEWECDLLDFVSALAELDRETASTVHVEGDYVSISLASGAAALHNLATQLRGSLGPIAAEFTERAQIHVPSVYLNLYALFAAATVSNVTSTGAMPDTTAPDLTLALRCRDIQGKELRKRLRVRPIAAMFTDAQPKAEVTDVIMTGWFEITEI